MTGHLGPSFSMIIPIHFLTAWASDAFSSLFVSPRCLQDMHWLLLFSSPVLVIVVHMNLSDVLLANLLVECLYMYN